MSVITKFIVEYVWYFIVGAYLFLIGLAFLTVKLISDTILFRVFARIWMGERTSVLVKASLKKTTFKYLGGTYCIDEKAIYEERKAKGLRRRRYIEYIFGIEKPLKRKVFEMEKPIFIGAETWSMILDKKMAVEVASIGQKKQISSTMIMIIIGIVLLAAVVGVYGYTQGWFK